VVNPKVPVSTLQDLIAFAKANPDKVNFGTPGVGTAQHLAVEWLKTLAGVGMTHVPYRGAAPAMNDLLAGHVQLMCDNAANVLNHIKEGRLKALAIGAPPRIPELPDVPAVGELYPEFTASSWFSIVAPPKTPHAIVAKLSQAMAEAFHLPDVVKRLRGLGAVPVGSSPEETLTFVRQETDRWRKVIRNAGIKLQ
jgi:tripartite-type tricarboxylate transporter receptor subunit TctC